MSLIKIISGCQTGVDRAALDAALSVGFPCGGWCPAERTDEDGIIPAHYPVKALKKGGYKLRTIQNLADADGTLILYFGMLEGGTEETAYRCMKLHRSYKLIDGCEIPVCRAVELTKTFITEKRVAILNVAGPRASKSPQAYRYAYDLVSALLHDLFLTKNNAPTT